MALGRVYCFGPTFRAEKSKTRRHLTEFWMVEPEVAYATLDDIIELAEGLVVEVVGRVLERRRRELTVLERDTTTLERVTSPVPAHHLRRGRDAAEGEGAAVRMGWRLRQPGRNGDLGSVRSARSPSRDIPSAIKAFYFKPQPDRPEVSLSVDVLAPEGYGEIIGGGQRIDDYDLLLKRLEEHKLPARGYEWYLDLRRFGSVPHAGFGMGIERVVSWICGLEHLREAIPYPRMLHRLTP